MNTNSVAKTYMVHSFRVGDADDPDLYAADPLYKWEQSEEGKWVMSHAAETPSWHRMTGEYGFEYEIHALLSELNYVYWKLKFK